VSGTVKKVVGVDVKVKGRAESGSQYEAGVALKRSDSGIVSQQQFNLLSKNNSCSAQTHVCQLQRLASASVRIATTCMAVIMFTSIFVASHLFSFVLAFTF